MTDPPGIPTPSLLKVSCTLSLSVKWDDSTCPVRSGMGVKEISSPTPPGQTLAPESSARRSGEDQWDFVHL